MFPVDDAIEDLVDDFRARFARLGYGPGHYVLLCHAAFPIAVTPDLLYQIWQNFKEFPGASGTAQAVDVLAVSDVLLWSGWRQTGPEVFELPAPLRGYLLDRLRERFGAERVYRLAQFLYQYTERVAGNRYGAVFRQAQQLTALATLAPDEANDQLSSLLSTSVRDNNPSELLRLRNLIEPLTQQDIRFEGLLSYAKGLKARLMGMESTVAEAQFGQMAGAVVLTPNPAEGEPTLLLPALVAARLEGPRKKPVAKRKTPPAKGAGTALLIGINTYGGSMNLSGPLNDAHLLRQTLTNLGVFPKNRIQTLTDAKATRQAVVGRLKEVLKKAGPDDLVLVAFSGHGLNTRQGAKENAMLFFHPFWQENPARPLKRIPEDARLTEREFRELVNTHATQNPYVLLLTDTHHGSPDWLDPANDKHLVLTAGSEYDVVDEFSVEGRTQGVFTWALTQVLAEKGLRLSYHHLLRSLAERVDAQHFTQTPQAFGTPSALRRPVFSTDDSGVLYAQELTRQVGFESPLDGHDLAAARHALVGYSFPPSARPELADLTSGLERLVRLGANRQQLSVLVLGRDVSRSSQLLADGLAEWLAVPYELQFQEAGGTDFYGSSTKNTRSEVVAQTESETVVILLLSRSLVNDPDFHALADKLVSRSRFGQQLLFPVLIEEADWRASSLRLVPPYPRPSTAAAPIKPTETPAEWGRFFREIAANLNAFAPFLPKTPIDPYHRATGVVLVGSNNFRAMGFLVGEGLLLTTHELFADPEAARRSDNARTLRLADEEHRLTVRFRLDPERFFLTNLPNRFALVAVAGQSEEGSYALADFPVMPSGATADTRNTGFPGKLVALLHDNQEVLRQCLLADFTQLEGEGLHFSDPNGAENVGAPLFSTNPWQLVAMHPGPSASPKQDLPLHITRSIRTLLQQALDQATPPQQEYLRPRLAHWFAEALPA